MLLCLCAMLACSSIAAQRPNILLIMGDDIGFSDLGCQGGEAKTPVLDNLAANGVRLTQFYNTARCCPTRAALLTGLYPHQAGIGHMNHRDMGYDGYRGNLNSNCVTIAEVLRASGYRTYMCGKWHVTRFYNRTDDPSQWPVQRGFEKFYGTLQGSGSFFDPSSLCRQNDYITPFTDPDYKPDRFYYTDAISDNAVLYLKQHQAETAGKPFFMYLAYTAAHWPMHALQEDIEKYKGRFNTGYDALRKERLERMKKLGLVDPRWVCSPTEGDWSSVENREWELRCMEVYAAMIDRMDQGIGRIVAQLKSSGQLDNTVIFFLQDNGACAEENGRGRDRSAPVADLQPMQPGEFQVTRPVRTRAGKPVRSGPDAMPGTDDTFIAYGKKWANVSNTPFREFKHWVHEGGISTPLIIHWPKGIARSQTGRLIPTPGHLIDIMATCVDLAGANYPGAQIRKSVPPMEGTSLKPILEGKPLDRKNPLFWEHESNRAVREGRWKLVAKAGQPWELYDIEADRTEMHNLAEANPALVKDLAAKWDAWAARAKVLPLGGWENPAPGSSTPGPAKKKKKKNKT